MIKYRKMLILISFCLISLLLPNTVQAASNNILMYLDCSYNISYGEDNIKSKNISAYSSELHIGYTEILDGKEKTYKVQVTDASGSFYNDLNGNFNEKFNIKIAETNRTRSTFTAAYAANSSSCPKYMTVEHDSGDEYTALFSNELSENCSGTPGTQCKMIYNYSKNSYKVFISPTEDIWSYSTGTQSSKICDYLNLDLTVSTGKQIKILGTYSKESKYEKYTNLTSPQTVQIVKFADLANLARNKKVDIVSFDPETNNFLGTTGVHFVSQSDYNWYYSATLDLACEIKNPTFTIKKTCTTYDDISETVTSKMNAAFASAKSIDDISQKYLNYNTYVQAYSLKSYKTEEDANNLLTWGTEIDTAIKNSTFKTVSAEFTDYLADLTEGDELCSEAKTRTLAVMNAYIDYNDAQKEKVGLLNETLTNMRNRASELGETEIVATLDGYIANAKALEAALATVSVKARDSYLNDTDFNIGIIPNSECGIISEDLKNFLQTIIDYIRIAGIVLAVILGILDYIKVIFGSDEKSMAKANKNFSTRLIAVALLFLIPAILNFVLGLFNILGTGVSGTCGIN